MQDAYQYDPLGRLATHISGLGQANLNYLGESGQLTGRSGLVTGSSAVWSNTRSYLDNSQDRRLWFTYNAVSQIVRRKLGSRHLRRICRRRIPHNKPGVVRKPL